MPKNDKFAVELTLVSDIIIEYEKEHYPIDKPSVAELTQLYRDFPAELMLGL